MMKISLKAHGWVEIPLGYTAMEFVIPDESRLIDFLNALVETIPEDRKEKIWDKTTGRFRVPIFVMIESKEVHDFTIPLTEGQEIALISPMAGG